MDCQLLQPSCVFLLLLLQAAAAPANFTEVRVRLAATFKLEVSGPGLSVHDRILLRDAGSGCPGGGADADRRASSGAVAGVVWSVSSWLLSRWQVSLLLVLLHGGCWRMRSLRDDYLQKGPHFEPCGA